MVMLRTKGFVSILIFTVMFSSAWVLNVYNEHNVYINEVHDAEGIQILGEESDSVFKEPFRPREYIKIR